MIALLTWLYGVATASAMIREDASSPAGSVARNMSARRETSEKALILMDQE